MIPIRASAFLSNPAAFKSGISAAAVADRAGPLHDGRPSARLFVMTAALEDHELCFSQLVDEPVLFVYAAAPQAGEFVFQRLRPADPVVAVTLYVFYELVYPPEYFFVPGVPI